MKNSLKQKRWPYYRIFHIEKNGLRLEIKEPNHYSSRLVPFEHIGSDEIVTKHQPDPYAVGFFISLLINILIALFLALDEYDLGVGVMSGLTSGITVAFAVWGAALFKFEKKKYLQSSEISLPFYYFKKEQVRVDRFIEDLKAKKKRYFREKYMRIDDYADLYSLPFTFKRLLYLEYISESEYTELIEEVERRKLINGL